MLTYFSDSSLVSDLTKWSSHLLSKTSTLCNFNLESQDLFADLTTTNWAPWDFETLGASPVDEWVFIIIWTETPHLFQYPNLLLFGVNVVEVSLQKQLEESWLRIGPSRGNYSIWMTAFFPSSPQGIYTWSLGHT